MSASPGWAPSAPPAEAAAPLTPAAIIITRPSSPDDPPKSAQSALAPSHVDTFAVRTLSDVTAKNPPVTPSTAKPSPPASPPTPPSAFEQRLAAMETPSSGPELFNARRTMWREPGENPPTPTQPNPSRLRLENILAVPGAIESDETWAAGIDRVWNGLVGGAKLRHRLPLALVIKILQAGWIHEGTWPRGAAVPDSDSELAQPDMNSPGQSSVLSTTEFSPGATTPGSAHAFNVSEGVEKIGVIEAASGRELMFGMSLE